MLSADWFQNYLQKSNEKIKQETKNIIAIFKQPVAENTKSRQ